MAYAANHDVYKSMAALSAATVLDPTHFWARLKYAELNYRLRALPVAEDETLKALRLARGPREAHAAEEQLREIRNLLNRLARPLTLPALI
jgi:hypothetical protein